MVGTLNGRGSTAPTDLTERWLRKVEERKQARQSAEPVVVELPSGLYVKAAQAPLASLLEAGRIPDGLTPYVMELLKLGHEAGPDRVNEVLLDDLLSYARMLNAVWLACVVEPAFSLLGDDGTLPLSEVEDQDKVALFNWAQGVPDYLAPFRESGDAPRASQDREDLRPAPSPYVRRRPAQRDVTGLPVDASDVLRGDSGRQPAAADAHGMGAGAEAAEGHDGQAGADLDVQAGGRTRGTAGGRRGTGRGRSDRGTGTTRAA